jgi:hypothetical protein
VNCPKVMVSTFAYGLQAVVALVGLCPGEGDGRRAWAVDPTLRVAKFSVHLLEDTVRVSPPETLRR